ncbi:zf-HC2 domain-containing protein [Streptomyces liangshanensis]|uniref:zf-HC2 domain-containing protein n=1 Tax=Streptomyces liangshanensis TaxID=2717324 RepID=UPI001FBB3F99|nr:zf-HC2 domain-containing protein [Streptomyces liangshanensis]
MTGPLDGGPDDGQDEPDGPEGPGRRDGRRRRLPWLPGPRAAPDDLEPEPGPTPPPARPAPVPPAAPVPPDLPDPHDLPDRHDPYDLPDGPDASGLSGGSGLLSGLGLPEPAVTSASPGPPAPSSAATPASGRGGKRRKGLSHKVLKSLLGAWALSACSAEETDLVEEHLTECAPCAEEALRLRDAVGLLQDDRSLDLDPMLRNRVLETCLGRRPARIPVPGWAASYDAETARLDALLRDFGDEEWRAPVTLKWFQDDRTASRGTTVAGVIGHLMAVDGLVAAALGLDDPLAAPLGESLGEPVPAGPADRTARFWRDSVFPPTRTVRGPWREQSHTLIRTVSFAGRGAAELSVSYGDFALPLCDALLDRAFECWVHGADIAEAVDYPYDPPSGPHLHRMVDLAARLLPAALAARRRGGLASPARGLVMPGAPGRSLHLEVEGPGGGDWYIPLDSPAAVGCPERSVAQIALDGVEFCQLVAGHVSPEEAAAGQDGDREAIRDVLLAAAAMSRI